MSPYTTRVIENLRQHDSASIAIVDSSGESISYGELCSKVESLALYLKKSSGRPLVFLYTNARADSLLLYLACLSAGFPVCLLEASHTEPAKELLQSYDNPHLLFPEEMPAPKGYASSEKIPSSSFCFAKAKKNGEYSSKLHPDLALLLQTSGSTGNPKLVRLTQKNLEANARSIIEYLKIEPSHRSMQSLPMSYSYGLSLVNSHLLAGATVVLSAHSFVRPEFWKDFDAQRCTSFAGVPFMYETLEKLRFEPAEHPTLKIMTQAGGGLRHDLVKSFLEKTKKAKAKFYVMYGQTEATARICYVPPEKLSEKIGSIGIPIPGGKIELKEVSGMTQGKELIYSGPNVMLGYAENAEALSLGDELHGKLSTGDLARVDADGFYFIEGRIKRFAKIFGLRIHLEDVEKKLESLYPVRAAVIDGGDSVRIFIESEEKLELAKIPSYLSGWLQLPAKTFVVRQLEALPRNSSGKKDYSKLLFE